MAATARVLQEDDGTTFAANDGACFRTTFEVSRVGRTVTVRADVEGGGYPTFIRRQFDLIVHGAVADAVVVDGTPRTLDGGRIALANDGLAFTVELEAT